MNAPTIPTTESELRFALIDAQDALINANGTIAALRGRLAVAEATHQARTADLLAANNREVEARRKAEDERFMAVRANERIWRVIATIQEALETQQARAEAAERAMIGAPVDTGSPTAPMAAPIPDLPVRSIPMSTLPGVTPMTSPIAGVAASSRIYAGPDPIRPREIEDRT